MKKLLKQLQDNQNKHIISVSRLINMEVERLNQMGYESKSTKELFLELAKVYFVKKYKVVADNGIYPGQEALLELVSNESGLSQKDLAKKLKIKPPTVAVSIKRMEKTGWLTREVDEGDKRISRVFITEEGKKVLEEVKVKSKELDEIVFAGIPEVEKCLLHRILIQLIENIRNTMDQNELDEVMEEFHKHHHEHKQAAHQKKR